MINYILQVILFQVFFLAIYDFFLSKETFFTKNRWYLLSTPMLSFVLPLIKIPTLQKAVSQEFVIQLPEIVLNPDKVIQQTIQTTNIEKSINYVNILFWVGVAFFLILFLIKLMKIIRFIRENESIKKSDFILIFIPNQAKAFSFFNYIFLGEEVPKQQQEKVIQHELVHSQQKHSIDLLFFEILKIAMWFNPMIYFYQKRITLVHEYISDAVVAKSETKESYINSLLSSFFQVENIEFVNQFYKKSLIKKRIIMMKKNQSKTVNQLKYLVLLPVLLSMLFYSSCADENLITKEKHESVKQQKVRYFQIGDNPMRETKMDEESYLDIYFGIKEPEWPEITYNDLSFEEAEEFEIQMNKIKSSDSDFSNSITLKVYQRNEGRRVLASIIDMEKMKSLREKVTTETEEVSFMKIDRAPTFSGCEAGDKKCFSLMIQKHFVKNFDANLPKTLGLDPGKKRVFIAFKIDKEGNVIDVKVRAPHQKIQDEVISVMNSLPKMVPGENDGKVVAVKYSIPFTIIVA
ncbi:M56 family metallopeptidase [Polaribacter sp. R77954]|uniref:M56 family metallopeptidase n=1 Tax=Polaribacter sp. R77954 TaxID=3093870 RepID=UPI0037C59B43